jgi:hypothetical protein
MDARNVRKYITQDLTEKEKQSYLDYINGDKLSTDWIEKGNSRRNILLLLEPKCEESSNNVRCDDWVNIYENGICKCTKGHQSYNWIGKLNST